MRSFENETIWIVGASSGIGRALSVALAKRGARLLLSARREDELKALNLELGGGHVVIPFDVSVRGEIEGAVRYIKEKKLIPNRAIFMAAIYTPQTIKEMDLEFAEKMVNVNVLGCFYFSKHVFKLLLEQAEVIGQSSGVQQIALCGSVAAYSGLPKGQPYSATKAAVKNFAETLYSEAPSSIDVKLISPGFVQSRITDLNDFEMPYIMEPEGAAQRILKGLQSSGFEIHFPKRLSLQLKLLSILPNWLSRKLTRWFLG